MPLFQILSSFSLSHSLSLSLSLLQDQCKNMPAAVIWLCSLLIALCSLAGNCISTQPESSILQEPELPCSKEDTGVQGKLTRREILNKLSRHSVELTQLNEVENLEKEERERRDDDDDDDVSGAGSGESDLNPEVDPLKSQSPYTTSTPGVLSLIIDTLTSVILFKTSEDCTSGWKEMLATGDDRESENEGLKALDSFGRVGAGYFQGNVFALGSYDGCHSLPTTQYCLSEFEFDSQQQRRIALLHGSCLPQACSREDMRLAVNLTSSRLNLVVNVGDVTCEGESKAHYNAGSIIILIVWCVFATIVSVATAGQLIHQKMIKYRPITQDAETARPRSLTRNRRSLSETLRKFLFCFSLYETVPQIFAIKHQPSSAITCLHGLRVISMCWIILGHQNLFGNFVIENSISYIANSVSHISYRGISESELAVDSFFLMSGLLVTYLTLRKMERRKGKFKFPAFLYYVHRFLRLTPVYAFVLFSYWLLTVHLADGPVWRKTIGENSDFYKSCERYWWTNLLYINNIYPRKHLHICMPWSWYLANDMQFYILAPLIIVPLSLNHKVGLTLIGLLVTANVVIIGGIAGGYGLSANSAKFEELTLALQDRENYHNLTDDIYTKPWTRVGPYLIGILIGYILYKQQKKPVFKTERSNYVFYGCLWVIAAAICASSVYGPQKRYDGSFTKAEDLIYLMFGRLAWAVAVAIIIFACHNGYGWIVNDILSLKIWIPLSRLTFTTYLVHGVVLYILLFTGRRPFFADSVNQALYFITAVAMSFSVAAVLSSFVEFPLSNVEEYSFKLAGFDGERESTRRSNVRERECVVERNVYFEDEDGPGRERGDEVMEGGGDGVRGGQSEDVRDANLSEFEMQEVVMANFAAIDSDSETEKEEEEEEEGKTVETENDGEQENGEAGEGVRNEGEGVREGAVEQGTEGAATELSSEAESLSKGSE